MATFEGLIVGLGLPVGNCTETFRLWQ